MTDKYMDSIIEKMGKGDEPAFEVFYRMTMTSISSVLSDFYNAEWQRPNPNAGAMLIGMTIGFSTDHSFFFNRFLKDDLSDEAAKDAAQKYLKGYSKSFMTAFNAGRAGQKRRVKTE